MSAINPVPPYWVSLLQAAIEIANGRFRYQLGDSDEAISNAIRTGEIPLRGKPKGAAALMRIDRLDLKRAHVEVTLCMIDLGGAYFANSETRTFCDVQVDFAKLVEYLRENLCIRDEPAIGATPASTAESRFSVWLEKSAHKGRRLVKAHLWKQINSADHELYNDCGQRRLSRRAFDRIWANVAPEDWKLPGAPSKR